MIKYQNEVIIISSDVSVNRLVKIVGGLEYFLTYKSQHTISVELNIGVCDIQIIIKIYDENEDDDIYINSIIFSGKHKGFADDNDLYVLTKEKTNDFKQDDILKLIQEFFN